MEYIATICLLKDKLNAVDIKRTDTELCLRMMAALAEYSEGLPLYEAWKWLDNQFMHDSK